MNISLEMRLVQVDFEMRRNELCVCASWYGRICGKFSLTMCNFLFTRLAHTHTYTNTYDAKCLLFQNKQPRMRTAIPGDASDS